ncbi:MAG: ATPase [Meiothermus sp.]|uniref:N-acetylglucosamine kinase n=1 Tax=Meiothermus sp. TaxID=1955249 RepID=UPI0025E45693|nr:BadF/BadG/BcrA/BcrD ATPase family protein [Meiothermus sp.]MCS7068465.1 ATPase [Meiothermus sp.]MCX7601198.1 ATPase [Meiothermus sp.]MDW8425090.1 BadF/BadG/BcrA/BcrD ATPase family protein [Meiothermus sp.]
MSRVLGIDGGASSSKWAVLDAAGQVVAQGRAAPIVGHLFNEEMRAQVWVALDALLAETSPYAPAAVVAGITGLDGGTPEARHFGAHIARALGLADERVRVLNDMDLVYRAHFAPGEGVVVYAGTGSVAYSIAPDGAVYRAGGHGYLIGDEGAGFWIGKTALRHLLRWHDAGLDTASYPLARQLYAMLGGRDWPRIRAYVYGGGRQAVAALAPAVGRAAEEGDETATQVLLQAGRELAELALTLRHRLGPLPVVLCGGALQVSPLIEQGARELLEFTVQYASSAEAAARMALEILKAEGQSDAF